MYACAGMNVHVCVVRLHYILADQLMYIAIPVGASLRAYDSRGLLLSMLLCIQSRPERELLVTKVPLHAQHSTTGPVTELKLCRLQSVGKILMVVLNIL